VASYYELDVDSDASKYDLVIVKMSVPAGGLNLRVDLFDADMIYPEVDWTACGGA